MGRAELCSIPILTSSSRGSRIQQRAIEKAERSGFLNISYKNLKYGNQPHDIGSWHPLMPLAGQSPCLVESHRGEGGPGSAELCPLCARCWWWRLENPGNPGLRSGSARGACVAEAPAWPGWAQPRRSRTWDTQGPRATHRAAYRVTGAATTKLKPRVRVSGEKGRGDARTPESRAAPPAAASCGGISANFQNHSHPSRRLPGPCWAGFITPFSPPALPQAGESPVGAAPLLPHATELTGSHRGRRRPPRADRLPASCELNPASWPWLLQPYFRSGLGARGDRAGKRSWLFPRVSAPQSSLVPELGLRPVILPVAGKCARHSG